MDTTKLFDAVKVPAGLERINYIATSRDEFKADSVSPTPGVDIPLMRVIGAVSHHEWKAAKDGREYLFLKGKFVALPVDGGPEFAAIRAGGFIPPDCVASEISFDGCSIDMVVLKRYNAKAPAKFSLAVVMAPAMDKALAMAEAVQQSLNGGDSEPAAPAALPPANSRPKRKATEDIPF